MEFWKETVVDTVVNQINFTNRSLHSLERLRRLHNSHARTENPIHTVGERGGYRLHGNYWPRIPTMDSAAARAPLNVPPLAPFRIPPSASPLSGWLRPCRYLSDTSDWSAVPPIKTRFNLQQRVPFTGQRHRPVALATQTIKVKKHREFDQVCSVQNTDYCDLLQRAEIWLGGGLGAIAPRLFYHICRDVCKEWLLTGAFCARSFLHKCDLISIGLVGSNKQRMDDLLCVLESYEYYCWDCFIAGSPTQRIQAGTCE
ncbi:hypothetical protein TcasGA2_TC003749 [Tribolium castaneum]|uniref:Uncharacterized protein n=1 Tax=Tribolium castaneum TaxID=7070 RepID=D6WE95_TRICA|nr:hypothetical protein TcasGA2_TC003749 [Tribolium castaneum]